MNRSAPKLTLLLAALAALALPSTGGAAAGADDGQAVHTVDVFNFGYADDSTGIPVTVASPGDLIVFRVSSGAHTVTEGVAGRANPLGPSFDSPILTVGQSWTLVAEAGVFAYTCKLHPSMDAILVVN